MNLYRTGGDIGPAFTSVIGESYATVQYNDRPDPFSRPGCWACELLVTEFSTATVCISL